MMIKLSILLKLLHQIIYVSAALKLLNGNFNLINIKKLLKFQGVTFVKSNESKNLIGKYAIFALKKIIFVVNVCQNANHMANIS